MSASGGYTPDTQVRHCHQCGAALVAGGAYCWNCASVVAAPAPRRQANVNAIVALALGGSAFGCFPLGIAALVVGTKARNEIAASDGREWGAELALAGMILAGVGLLFFVAMLLLQLTLLAAGE
ncbi:MAG: DUF4190 domain-containing protein [Acidimicrobiales bacterium]|nr:DUF4190 domain-containing protein [Acidimicrobiales bacterium]